jgi:hypothetical protein
MNSRELIEQMNVDRNREQAPSGFAQFVGAIVAGVVVCALIVLTFSM